MPHGVGCAAHPSIPFIDTTHERRDMWLLKRYGLPAMYWNLILRGPGVTVTGLLLDLRR